MKNILELGKVVNTHGIRGEVKIQPWCDDPEIFDELEYIYIDNKKFDIEKTVYTKTEGTVTVTEWFKYPNFREKKSYVYKVRQREGIWQIYDYTVTNLGTE